MSIIPLNWFEHYTTKTGSTKATAQERGFWTPVSFPSPVGFGTITARVLRTFTTGEPACAGGSHAWELHNVNGGDGPNARVYHVCHRCSTIRERSHTAYYTDAKSEAAQIRAIKSEIAKLAVRP